MDRRERQVIDELFGKLRQVEQQRRSATPRRRRTSPQVSGLLQPPTTWRRRSWCMSRRWPTCRPRPELEGQLAERPAGGGFLSACSAGPQQRRRRRSGRWRRSSMA